MKSVKVKSYEKMVQNSIKEREIESLKYLVEYGQSIAREASMGLKTGFYDIGYLGEKVRKAESRFQTLTKIQKDRYSWMKKL